MAARKPRKSENETAEDYGTRMREVREWIGWTPDEAAEALTLAGCPTKRQTVYRIEEGNYWTNRAIRAVMLAYGLTYDEVVAPTERNAIAVTREEIKEAIIIKRDENKASR
ncbi:MAG: hypothetical protein AAF532_16465 [Planctomycetota bacterium]